MSLEICLSFVVTFFISLLCVPVVSRISKELGIIAHTNNRTIHKGIIARTGGYAIYVSFLIGTMIFLKTDTQINSMLIGGFIIFLTGLYDDIHDLSPKYKLLGQIVGALIVIFYGGISLKGFTIPFLPSMVSHVLAIIITIGWIVGISNAVNLIDGLDGLCGGISIIVLVTISITSLTYGRSDISSLSLLLGGAIAGFLVYNFHPASVFLGDCGALFIGFMIAVISLLGFGYKSSSFFTLGAPIVVLMVPIMDTLIAIIRRKVHHKSFSEADRNHLHHKLMFSLELGQTKSVLILYGVTVLFSLCSYIYLYDKIAATLLFITLMVLFEIFVEMTGMIDRKYRPLLTFINIFVKSDQLPSIKDTKPYQRIADKINKKGLAIGVVVLCLLFSTIFVVNRNNHPIHPEPTEVVYKELDHETKLMSDVYNQLMTAVHRNNEEHIRELVAVYFAADYYSLVNKEKDQIGGLSYFYNDKKNDFVSYAKNAYYKDLNTLIDQKANTQEVVSYKVLANESSNKALSGLEDYSYYDIKLLLRFQKENELLHTTEYETTITLIKMNNQFSIIAVEE